MLGKELNKKERRRSAMAKMVVKQEEYIKSYKG